MSSTKKGIVLLLCLGFTRAGAAFAEPSYLVYPNGPALFRYDVARYDAIGSDEAVYDPSYAVDNVMLWDRVDQRVPVEIYRAPQLIGFEPTNGPSEFVIFRNDFELIIDGFGRGPRTLGNLHLRFWPDVRQTTAVLTVDGIETDRLTVPLAALEVVTPVEDGYYSDARTHHVSWTGGSAMKITAFSDKDGDGKFEGTPLYRISALHAAIATEPATWGKVKALYR
jgi:hypothetical protein